MTRLVGLFAGVISWLALASPPAQATGLPLITSATVDYTHSTLTISGQNSGSSPAVTLDNLSFTTVSGASIRIRLSRISRVGSRHRVSRRGLTF